MNTEPTTITPGVPPAGTNFEPTKSSPHEPSVPSCGSSDNLVSDQFVYAFGKLEVRFPTLGVNREFQQREAQEAKSTDKTLTREERISHVLEANHHLASRVCYLLTVSGIPAYVLVRPGWHLRESLLQAIAQSQKPDCWSVIIGRRGPVSSPAICAGVLAPMAVCDQIYTFSLKDWQESLAKTLKSALQARKITEKVFEQTTREMFDRIVCSAENLGFANSHRALNYLVLQHPGLFLAVAERSGKQVLDKIETREAQAMGTRHVIAIILTFLDLTTGVPERVFTRVDVTEEWPFVADMPDGSRSPLGLIPFVDNGLWGTLF